MERKKGDVVLDCGACEGYFTRKALDDGAKKVYCIEPASSMVQCLKKTFADEIMDGRVSLSSCLVGNKNESAVFYENLMDTAEGTTEPVAHENGRSLLAKELTMLTIDEFIDRESVGKLDFIKADVEGSEIDLVLGAEKTIRKFRPSLAIAVYHKPENANKIVEFIEGLCLDYSTRVKGIRVRGHSADKDRISRPVMVHCYQKQWH